MTKAVDKRYFTYPIHGKTSSATSGTSMSVVLGPEAIKSTNYGSGTDSTSISSHMKPLNTKDYTIVGTGTKGLWVAGHLLNDNLGGSGTDAENLTPLTQTANKQHSGFEGKIKAGLEASRQLMEGYLSIPFIVGIKYEVAVSSATFGSFSPYDNAPSHISIKTTLVKADKKTFDIDVLGVSDWTGIPASIANYLKAAVFSTDIHNDDNHLQGCVNSNCMH